MDACMKLKSSLCLLLSLSPCLASDIAEAAIPVVTVQPASSTESTGALLPAPDDDAQDWAREENWVGATTAIPMSHEEEREDWVRTAAMPISYQKVDSPSPSLLDLRDADRRITTKTNGARYVASPCEADEIHTLNGRNLIDREREELNILTSRNPHCSASSFSDRAKELHPLLRISTRTHAASAPGSLPASKLPVFLSDSDSDSHDSQEEIS